MIKKFQRQNSLELMVMVFCLIVITALSIFFLYLRGTFKERDITEHGGPHILVLLPSIEKEEYNAFQMMAQGIADQYNFQIETMRLSTVAMQQKMLSLIPMTDIDAVLLWAVSDLDEDYAQELSTCRAAGIPVVVIDHDFDDKTLRNSFIGSGTNSELMIINQMIWSIENDAPIIIGNYLHSSSGDIYELLIMEKEENPDFQSEQIWSERLKVFAENPPNDYYADQYIQVCASAGGTAVLDIELRNALMDIGSSGLFFSLSEALTGSLAMAIDGGFLDSHSPQFFVGYGKEHRLSKYIEAGVIDELIVFDALYSSKIGLRYLNDILRGFYVPPTLDSGAKLIM